MKDRNDLIEFLRFLIRERKFIAVVTACLTAAAIIVSLVIPKKFQAEVTLVPISSSNSSLGGLLQSEGLGSLLGTVLGGSAQMNSEENLIVILKSYALIQRTIERFHLQAELHPRKWDRDRDTWKTGVEPVSMDRMVEEFGDKLVEITPKKSGLIAVGVELRDPALASVVANSMVAMLQDFINGSVLTRGKKHRLFIEDQLEKNKIELTKIENGLQTFEEKHKIVEMESQTALALETYSNLQARMISNNIRLAEITESYGTEDPTYRKLQVANRALNQELRSLERSMPKKVDSGTVLFGRLEKFPALKLQYLQLKRDLLVQEKVFAFLKEQYEIARIDEVRDDISFQIIDSAHPPQEKSSPRRALITVATCFLGFWAAVGIAFFRRSMLPQLRNDPAA